MHDALSLLSGMRTARFAGLRSRLPFLSTGDEDSPDEAATDAESVEESRAEASTGDPDEATAEPGGRFAAVRERLPFVPAPDETPPADAGTEPPSGRLAGVRERLPLVPSGEPAADVAEPVETGPDWRDAMVDPIEESSLLTPNRVLAVGGSLVGVGGLLSMYALLKRRAARAVPDEQTWGVAGADDDEQDRGGLLGLAFLLGSSAAVRRLRRDDEAE